MRFSILLLVALPAAASWFGGSDKTDYTTWNADELKGWLEAHKINVPEGYSTKDMQALVKANWDDSVNWTQEQYNKAQKAFSDVKQSSFDSWDESKLRQFLLEQGIVAPSSKKEELVLLANKQYRAFTNAASSMASSASATASSAMYGGPVDQATNSLSSVIAQATTSVARAMEDSKDYVYSSWTDSELRSYLQNKGVIRTDAQITRDEMLAKMKSAYATVADPVYDAWSDSYMHDWLVAHGIIKSDFEKKRDKLTGLLASYYYSISDSVYSTWDDSMLKAWLVEHNVVKSNAQVTREKMLKMVQDNYAAASDTIYGGWKDSEMRQWLIDNGYMKSDAQAKRDELVALMQAKYNDASSRVAAYTVWPDARLRAFLRNHGVTEAHMPKTRADLLHEVRIRYVQTQWGVEAMYAKIKSALGSGVENVEEKFGKIMEILTGAKDDVGAAGSKATDRAKNEL